MNTSARTYGPAAREAIESRFARNIAARLSERAENVAPEIGERLRFAREKALEVGRLARAGAEVQSAGGGTAILGFSRSPWWQRIASVLPLAALVGGLVLIEDWHDPLADLGRGRGRCRPARRRPADQRLPGSRFRRIPEGSTRRMRRPAMTPGLCRRVAGLALAAIALAAGVAALAQTPAAAGAQDPRSSAAVRHAGRPAARPACAGSR